MLWYISSTSQWENSRSRVGEHWAKNTNRNLKTRHFASWPQCLLMFHPKCSWSSSNISTGPNLRVQHGFMGLDALSWVLLRCEFKESMMTALVPLMRGGSKGPQRLEDRAHDWEGLRAPQRQGQEGARHWGLCLPLAGLCGEVTDWVSLENLVSQTFVFPSSRFLTFPVSSLLNQVQRPRFSLPLLQLVTRCKEPT